MKTILRIFVTIALFIIMAFSLQAQNTEQFVVLHCESPGTLDLSFESRLAPYLKVTGDIDARDIKFLKQVTINVTQILDLSDAVINEYYGTGGTELDLSANWIWSPPVPRLYPANTLPMWAFAEVLDNSLYKYIRGSYSLRKLILPKTLTGFMEDALTENYVLTTLEVPASSTTICGDGHLVYSYDGSTLLAMAPAYYGDLTVAESVVNVADGVFKGMKPASVTFKSPQIPAFGEKNNIDAAYIIAENPDSYKALFPNIDCLKSMETIKVENAVPGQLLSTIGNQGYKRSDVRSLKVSGTLNYNDFLNVIELPNLHKADLSEAIVEMDEWYKDCDFSNPSVTHFDFPSFINVNNPEWPLLNLKINGKSRLNGHLNVPEGTSSWIKSDSRRFTSVCFPSSLEYINPELFDGETAVESVDFSKCIRLEEICGLSSGNLSEVKLPEGLKKLEDISGPIKEINLPNTLEYIGLNGRWMLEKLVLPSSLKYFSINSLPFVKEIDATNATGLTEIRGLNHSPNLKSLDLSSCPILNAYNLFCADLLPTSSNPLYKSPQRIVMVGGTAYAAPKVAAIEHLVLPSTLKSLTGIEFCQNLKKIELDHCFRLKSIYGLNDCPSLEDLSLPESIVSVEGMTNCPMLKNISVAASTPPTMLTNFDFSNVTLSIGYGSKGIYRMAEGWENCAQINEIGYRVSFDIDRLGGILSDPSLVLLNGAGLYEMGEEAVLMAPAFGAYKTVGWEINGQKNVDNPHVVKVEQNIIAAPIYTIDQNLCDVVMSVDAPKEQTMKLKITTRDDDYEIYVDGSLYTHFEDKGNNWSEKTYSINLSSGKHTISLNGKNLILDFEAIQEEEEMENNYSITSFTVNNKQSLYKLNTRYFNIDNLDLSGSVYLENLDINGNNIVHNLNLSNCLVLRSIYDRGKNIISNLDVSYCPQLELVSVCCAELENITCCNTGLKELYVSRNKLKSLDLSGISTLTAIAADDNLLTEFKMDAPDCEYLDLQDNPMTFSTLTPQMYNIYMAKKPEFFEYYDIRIKTDDSLINATGTIDLDVMTPADCDTPTIVTINGKVANNEDGSSVFPVPWGWYDIILSNESYPGLRYISEGRSEYEHPIEGIIYNPSNVTLRVGESLQIECSIIPASTPCPYIYWFSNNESVVSVDKFTGIIEALSPGVATISAIINYFDNSGGCEITVVDEAALHDVTADMNFVRVENRNIVVDSPIEVAIYASDGSIVYRGHKGLVTNISPGVYIAVAQGELGSGQSFTKKLFVK